MWIDPERPYPTGVYSITNRANGKVYVGGGYVDVDKRLQEYIDGLPKGKCHNRHLLRAFKKYGPKVWQYVIEEYCPPEKVKEREQYWLDITESGNPKLSYNICTIAGSPLGIKHSDETRALLSLLATGRVQSEETKAKRSATLMGHPVSDKVREAVAAYRRGKKLDEEVCKKISESLLTYYETHEPRVFSPETIAKMSEAAKNRPPMTEETRAKVAAASRGRKHSEETRRKISEANTGHEVSEETRAKISEANLGRVFTEETREKNAEAQRKRYEDPEERKRTGKATSEGIRNSPEAMENRRRAGRISAEKRRARKAEKEAGGK